MLSRMTCGTKILAAFALAVAIMPRGTGYVQRRDPRESSTSPRTAPAPRPPQNHRGQLTVARVISDLCCATAILGSAEAFAEPRRAFGGSRIGADASSAGCEAG
jgi:hypothetical protein